MTSYERGFGDACRRFGVSPDRLTGFCKSAGIWGWLLGKGGGLFSKARRGVQLARGGRYANIIGKDGLIAEKALKDTKLVKELGLTGQQLKDLNAVKGLAKTPEEATKMTKGILGNSAAYAREAGLAKGVRYGLGGTALAGIGAYNLAKGDQGEQMPQQYNPYALQNLAGMTASPPLSQNFDTNYGQGGQNAYGQTSPYVVNAGPGRIPMGAGQASAVPSAAASGAPAMASAGHYWRDTNNGKYDPHYGKGYGNGYSAIGSMA